MSTIKTVAKAIAAFVGSSVTGISSILAGHESIGQITDGQWVTLFGVSFAAAMAVFGISNGSKT